MNDEDILGKIHSRGYWRVNIRPLIYKKDLINNLSECKEIINSCVVELRGWDYPHVSQQMANSQDYIVSKEDFWCHIEYWRFYKSGQFIHHFSMEEDWAEQVQGMKTPVEKGLAVESTVYRLTEILEFASRLTTKSFLQDGNIDISISLFGTKNRTLFMWDFARYLRKHTCTESDSIDIHKRISSHELQKNSSKISIEMINDVFEVFNWDQVPLAIFAEDQRKLLEKRL